MRREPFTMERDVLNVGDAVEIFESRLPRAYYYTVKPAQAMSGNIPLNHPISSRKGKVVEKTEDGAAWVLTIEFQED